ncbi:hypothetical protein FPV67DRAFT_1460800 [Lyophyllum atratum]|nr:hypothetical protein FPV67DRAFT_1460800 [Lyophyllum atratum]
MRFCSHSSFYLLHDHLPLSLSPPPHFGHPGLTRRHILSAQDDLTPPLPRRLGAKPATIIAKTAAAVAFASDGKKDWNTSVETAASRGLWSLRAGCRTHRGDVWKAVGDLITVRPISSGTCKSRTYPTSACTTLACAVPGPNAADSAAATAEAMGRRSRYSGGQQQEDETDDVNDEEEDASWPVETPDREATVISKTAPKSRKSKAKPKGSALDSCDLGAVLGLALASEPESGTAECGDGSTPFPLPTEIAVMITVTLDGTEGYLDFQATLGREKAATTENRGCREATAAIQPLETTVASQTARKHFKTSQTQSRHYRLE